LADFIADVAGTPLGERYALILALISAFFHAIFGAINKAGDDPFLNRGAINLFYGGMALPIALFVVPWPKADLLAPLAMSYLVHLGYEYLQASSYHRGAFTVVYPIARGAGPLAAALAAMVVFQETLRPGQWGGVALLSAAIMGLALVNIHAVRADPKNGPEIRRALSSAILTALAAGVMLAAYTIIDAYGARVAENPFTFIAWFFASGLVGFPLIALRRWRRLETKPDIRPLLRRGFAGGLIAFVSFGCVIMATRLGKVGEAAAMRETSIVFGAMIGMIWFRERLDAPRLALIGLIAAGAALVELG
jgi:drug/metabolite transporter (DMT)-like permease